MKKIKTITLLIIVSFISMNFSGCFNSFWRLLLQVQFYKHSAGLVPDLDNFAALNYSVYVGDNGKIFRSTEEGSIIFEEKISGTSERLNDVRVTTQSNGFVLAVGNNGAIVRSTNAGNNWIVSSSGTSSNLYGVDFTPVFYFAVGDNGTFLISVTGGANWSQQPSGTSRNLKAIGLTNMISELIAVGEKGTIIRSSNAGQIWSNVSIADTTITFYDISKKGRHYTTGNNACIVGTGGMIYKSTDNGATWVQKPSGTTNTLRSIYQHTADSIVVVGDNGTIRLSTNGGESWFSDPYFESPSTRHYRSVSLVNLDNKTYSALSDTLFFVSNEPLILGLNNVNTAISQTMSLHQNYPNPFNPATKIVFDLPKSSFAKLIVYDITGREIQTLVNEELHTGVYEYEWNAGSFPSGIYFYVLKTEDFSSTRKMILIK